jgi:UDP-N-acetylglucosamine 4,6-dehydratase/5-epimerase
METELSAAPHGDLIDFLAGRRILITGGTGSFGKTMVALCLERTSAKEVIVLSRDEQKHVALAREFQDQRLRTFLGDVRDLERLRLAMRGVDFVFNAAAIKHVHLTEEHPMEAVRTNILGANNVCQAALEAGAECVVTLSTDKAVEPVNVMGMSKSLQERVVAAYAGRGLRVGIVRYGNVLASNGSVVPYFNQLLEQGTTVLPVTDRRMTRFVLTLADSVHLVLHALKNAQDGETFVMNLPAFRIWDVATVMAEAAGTPSRPVQVEEVGIRPGEKLHECLISSEEMRRASQGGCFWAIRRYRSGLERFAAAQEERSLTSDGARHLSTDEIVKLLARQGCLPPRRGLGTVQTSGAAAPPAEL